MHIRLSLRLISMAAVAFWTTSAVGQEAIGVVKRTHGPVTIERAGVHLPAVKGIQVQAGDRIVTGAQGSVDITMRGSAVSVGERAHVGLDRYAPAQAQTSQAASAPPILQGLASFLSLHRHR